jgi:TolA-binding protein
MRGLFLLAPALSLLSSCVESPAVHLEKAQALTYQRKPTEALRAYDEVLSLLARKEGGRAVEQRVTALLAAGDLCYLELKQYARAAEYYRSLVDRHPQAPEALKAREHRSEIFRTHFHDRRAAVAELSAIVQTFPKHPGVDRFQYRAAKDYFDLGDFNQAIVESRVLHGRYPNSPFGDDAHLLIAESFAFLGQREKALEGHAALARGWPSSDLLARSNFEAAKLHSEAGAYEPAIEALVESLKTHPDPKAVQHEIGRLRKRLASLRAPEKVGWEAIWAEHPGPHLSARDHME